MSRGSRPVAAAHRGLTLIELMVVVAVLAILATIAIPTYDRYTRSARRADGRAAVTEIALAQERLYSINQRYAPDADTLVNLATLVSQVGLDPQLKDGKSAKQHYTLTIAAGPSGSRATSFLITATPVSADPDCTAMTLNSDGKKDGTPAGTHKCW